MEHIHVIEDKDKDWKWKNGDLAVRHWFKNRGKDISFDMLNIVEWDLLLTEPLDRLYDTVSQNQLGLTGLKPIEEAEEYGWDWVADQPYSGEWEELKNYVEQETGFARSSYGCIFPGACVPREFLERFAEIEVPELCNDEVRVPLFAEALGFDLEDTGFFPEWGDKHEYQYFNAIGNNIALERIEEELGKENGRRAFHPAREKIGIEKIREMKDN
ncbi:MAG: hypothetical protein ABEJ72_04615 [Candidatus Aenigmatarchaeota archaeon]